MDNLISRQAAIRWVKTECNPYGKPTLDFESGKKVIEHLEQMPSAERRGRWEFNIDDKGWSWDYPYMCDQCGEWVEKVFKFCPSCGAKMEGEQNE